MKKDEADAQRLHFLKWYRKSRQGFYCSQLDDQEIAAAGFYEGIHYALTGSDRPEGEGLHDITTRVHIRHERMTNGAISKTVWLLVGRNLVKIGDAGDITGTWRKVKP